MEDGTTADDPRLDRTLEELEAARFIAQASAALAQVADYESTLERIANLAVPAFADWFGVHVRESGGRVRRMAVRHRDPRMVRAVEEMYAHYPPDEGRPYGAPRVLATGEAIWAPDLAAIIPRAARDAPHAAMLRALGLTSYICMPMRSRGRVCGALTFATAESGRRYSEIHLRAAEDLAARCAVAIENAQLVGALREADRRKDEFLAILAHELRNPLAPLRNAVEILRLRAPDLPEVQMANDMMARQVRHLSRLVDDLLDVSRVSSGRIELRRETVALAAAIEAAVESSRPAIEAGRHQLAMVPAPEPIHVDADPVRLSQVLSNLLNNAARYTPPGGRITIESAREGGQAVIRVRDTGAGIPRDMLESIFEIFVQGPGTGGAAQGGLGIGLTLVKRLVELHGGTVTAHSAGPGQGSELTVRLPALESTPAEAGRAAKEGARADAHCAARRVLVVDDNHDAADSLAHVLGACGHEVRVAYDGVDAVSESLAFEPDVVLLDLGLPRLDGRDVARRLRRLRGDSVLLIAVTGWGQEDDRRRTREAGFDHHLTKPVDHERLQALLARLPADEAAEER